MKFLTTTKTFVSFEKLYGIRRGNLYIIYIFESTIIVLPTLHAINERALNVLTYCFRVIRFDD